MFGNCVFINYSLDSFMVMVIMMIWYNIICIKDIFNRLSSFCVIFFNFINYGVEVWELVFYKFIFVKFDFSY